MKDNHSRFLRSGAEHLLPTPVLAAYLDHLDAAPSVRDFWEQLCSRRRIRWIVHVDLNLDNITAASGIPDYHRYVIVNSVRAGQRGKGGALCEARRRTRNGVIVR